MASCRKTPQSRRCKAMFATMHQQGTYNGVYANISTRRRKGLRDSTGAGGDVVDYDGNVLTLHKTRNYYTNKFILY